MNKLNVAIADDNERVIQSLSEVIEKDENMPYCPETGERAEILLNPLGIKYAQLKSL